MVDVYVYVSDGAQAYIALKLPATPERLLPEKVWDFCKIRFAPLKIPRYLEYRSELPKTPSSKIQKGLLRAETNTLTQAVFDRLVLEKK